MGEKLNTNEQKIQYVNSIFKKIWLDYIHHAIEMNKDEIGDILKRNTELGLRKKYRNLQGKKLEEKIEEEFDGEFGRQAKLYTTTRQKGNELIRFYNGDVFAVELPDEQEEGEEITFGVNVKFNTKNVRESDMFNYFVDGIEHLIKSDYKNELKPHEITSGSEKFTEGKDKRQRIPVEVVSIKYLLPVENINKKSGSTEGYIKKLFITKVGRTISTIKDKNNILNKYR